MVTMKLTGAELLAATDATSLDHVMFGKMTADITARSDVLAEGARSLVERNIADANDDGTIRVRHVLSESLSLCENPDGEILVVHENNGVKALAWLMLHKDGRHLGFKTVSPNLCHLSAFHSSEIGEVVKDALDFLPETDGMACAWLAPVALVAPIVNAVDVSEEGYAHMVDGLIKCAVVDQEANAFANAIKHAHIRGLMTGYAVNHNGLAMPILVHSSGIWTVWIDVASGIALVRAGATSDTCDMIARIGRDLVEMVTA